MRIRLTRKLAQLLNGVDISRRTVGDVIDLPDREAALLLAEGWALPADGEAASQTPRGKPEPKGRRLKRQRPGRLATADDRAISRSRKRR